MNKNISFAVIGTLCEWAEFTFYAYMALKFAHLFFPTLSTSHAVIAVFGTFAVSYLARPLGGFLLGYLGDKRGRKTALSYSIIIMGVATFCIGILPTYAAIGVLAPILLLVLRFIQGLAVAGEFTGAAVFINEHQAKDGYLETSWVSTSSALGMLIGAGAAALISAPSMPEWAWRIPFMLAAASCIWAAYMRKNLTEPAVYQNAVVTANPFKLLFKDYKFAMLRVAALAAFVGIYIYICNVWWTTFIIQHGYFSSFQARLLSTIGQASVVVLTPLMALLANRYGGKKLMAIGFIGASGTAFLLFQQNISSSFYYAAFVSIVYGIFNTCVTGPMFKYLTQLFPTEVRFTGPAVSWNIAVALLGGTSPMVAQYLLIHMQTTYAPAFYVFLIASIALSLNCLPRRLTVK